MGVFHHNPHAHRYKLFFVLLVLPALTSAATLSQSHPLTLASVSANATITDLTSTTNNSSQLNFDANFHIYPIFGGPPLDTNAVLMSAVQFMARQAVEDIDGELPRTFWHSSDPRYASVGIYVLPAYSGDTVNRRMMTWGFDRALHYLMDHGQFFSVRFRMIRDGDNVGSIEFALSPEGQRGTISLGDRVPRLEQREEGVEPASANVGESLTLSVAGSRTYCRLCGYDLEAFEVFRPIVTILRRAAEFQPRHHIGSFQIPTEVGTTTLLFIDEERQSPPFFETQYLINAAVAVPQYMLDKGSFSETEIRIYVDGALVATGLLKIMRSPPPRPQRRKKSMCIIS